MSDTSKTGVYAVRAQEVVSINQGDLERQDFGIVGLLGLACVITCVYSSVVTTLATGISSGGPVLLLYGLVFAACGALLIALSLGELASAFPTSRGPMEWTYAFASPKYRRALSYYVGQLNWLGYSVISSGFSVLCAGQILGLVVLKHPDYVIKQWHSWLIAEGLLVLATIFNVFCLHIMPILDKISLYFFFFTFFVYLVVPVACANPTLSPPSFVFGEFINLTGYQPFVAFMVGLSGVTTAFGGTDAITHIAEEVMTPEKDIPRTMWLTVVIGFSSTFVLLISLLFAVKDIDSLLSTPTGQPYLQLLFDATESFAGTACMASLILVINGLAIIGLVLTASRVAFTVARDGGLLSQSYFARVHPTLHVPVRALLLTSATSMALASTSLGSTTALFSFLNSVIVLNWICYSIPIILLLVAKRRFAAPGPFQLGRAGWLINSLTVLYMCFQGIFFFLPYGLPAAVESMNYTCVVVVGLSVLVWMSWFIAGRKYYLVAPAEAVMEGRTISIDEDGRKQEA